MITLGELRLREILGISATGSRIFGKTLSSFGWNKSEALVMLFGVIIDEVSKNMNTFPINCLILRAHVLAKIAQFNFLPQGGHFHIIKMDFLLFLYTMLIPTNFNLSHFILSSMIVPHEQLGFPYLLTKVFTHFEIEHGTKTPSLGKESFGSASINRMFYKIMNGKIIAE